VTERFVLGPNRYGKSSVRVVKVHEDGSGISDVTVDVACVGDFVAVHLDGDNATVVPTDTMRNTVYALAQDRLGHEPERFARLIAAHFLEFPSIAGVEISIEERPWAAAEGRAFVRDGAERRTARITAGTLGDRVEAGIDGLLVLKTGGSSFVGFVRDRYTTLPDAEDRLLATELTAAWRYRGHPSDYSETWRSVRSTLIDTFGREPSRSVQEQAYRMGEAVLAAHSTIDEIDLGMPNRHHLAVDLSRFDIDDRGVVFQPVDEPFGDIHVTVRRA
jgi:urate oxidase